MSPDPSLAAPSFLRTKLVCPRYVSIAHYVELVRNGQIKTLPRELVAQVRLLMKETSIFHPASPQHPGAQNAHGKEYCTVASARKRCHLVALGGLRPSSGGICGHLMRGPGGMLCGVLCSPHDPLPEFFGLITQQLSLPADKFALDLCEFLWLFHTNELVREVERI